MKGDIRKKYQEYINHIDFPMIIYVYETNKIIALNDYAKEIVGSDCDDMKTIYDGKKLKFQKNLLDGGCKFFFNTKIYAKDKISYIDMDICVIKIENLHYVFMLFEYSIKNIFLGSLSVQIPRISWKYIDSEIIGISATLQSSLEEFYDCDDVKKEVSFEKVDNAEKVYNIKKIYNFFDTEVSKKMEETVNFAIKTKECQYNLIQMVTTGSKNNSFIKIHIMPIINNAGESIGILCTHNKILSRERNKALFDSTMKNNVLVNEIIDKGDTIFIGWLNDENTTIQYISQNIEKYGYRTDDFCSGNISFKDIIYPEDYSIIQCKFNMNIDINEGKKSVYEYRIKKATGEIVWVHEECMPVTLKDDIVYNFSSLYDITSRKMLENEKKKEYQLKKDWISSSDKVDYSIFNLDELFELKDFTKVQKFLSEHIDTVSFTTNVNGEIYTEPIIEMELSKSIKKIIINKKSQKIYKEIGQESFIQNKLIIKDFFDTELKIMSIPFSIEEVHIGNFIIISLLDDKNIRDYMSNIHFVWEYIECMCQAEYNNLKFLKEKNKIIIENYENACKNLEQILDNIDSYILAVNLDDYVIRYANKKVRLSYEDAMNNDIFAFFIENGIESKIKKGKYDDISKIIGYTTDKKENIEKTAILYDSSNNKYLSAKMELVKWSDYKNIILITINEIDEKEIDADIPEKRLCYDYFTGLPNRAKFEIDAKTSIMKSIEKNKSGAVILVTIDDFKYISFTFGHEYGEELLKSIANIFCGEVLIKNCTYRGRGIEFLILVDCENEKEVQKIAEKINSYFENPLNILDKKIECKISIGVTIFPKDGINPVELLKNADLAVYEARRSIEQKTIYYKIDNPIIEKLSNKTK